MSKEKIAAIAGLFILIGAFIDTNFNLLKGAGVPEIAINQIKLLGLAIAFILPGVAALFPKKEK